MVDVRNTGVERCMGMRRDVAASIGFAFLMLCCMLTIWGGLPLLKRTGLSLIPLLEWCSIPLLLSITATLFLEAYAFIVHSKLAGVISVFLKPITACALLLGGYVILIVVSPLSGEMAACAFGVFAGVGFATLLIKWEEILGTFEAKTVLKISLTALAVHSLAYAILALASSLVLETAFVASAIGSSILLCLLDHGKRHGASIDNVRAETDAPTFAASSDKPIRATKLHFDSVLKPLRNPLYCVAASIFAVAVTRTMALQATPNLPAVVGMVSAAGSVAASLIAGALLFGPVKIGKHSARADVALFFRVMFPIVATLLLAFSFFKGTELIVTTLMYATFSLLFALMMPSCLDAAQHQGVPVRFVFGVFASSVYAAFSAGAIVSIALYQLRAFDIPVTLVAALLVLYVLSMAYAGMQRRSRKDSDTEEGVDKTVYESQPDDPVDARCIIVSEQFDLSPRETDVLVAFAHGRNVAYVARQLCLSENTIRSHSKSLYTKLGIHSKQELLDLVESANN